MRDKLKDEKYFRNYLTKLQKEMSIVKYPGYLSTLFFKTIMAKYSIGENASSLMDDYNNMIDIFIKSFDKEMTSYDSILSALSLSVIFNIENIKKLEIIIKESEKYNDYIIQFLFNSKNYNDYNVKWEDMLPIKDIIEDCKNNNKKEAEKKMKSYLDNWYNNNEDAYWYETHKSKAKIYFGYWCLEAAALTYLLDLDDSEYLDNQYYPKDLVKYARNNKTV